MLSGEVGGQTGPVRAAAAAGLAAVATVPEPYPPPPTAALPSVAHNTSYDRLQSVLGYMYLARRGIRRGINHSAHDLRERFRGGGIGVNRRERLSLLAGLEQVRIHGDRSQERHPVRLRHPARTLAERRENRGLSQHTHQRGVRKYTGSKIKCCSLRAGALPAWVARGGREVSKTLEWCQMHEL